MKWCDDMVDRPPRKYLPGWMVDVAFTLAILVVLLLSIFGVLR